MPMLDPSMFDDATYAPSSQLPPWLSMIQGAPPSQPAAMGLLNGAALPMADPSQGALPSQDALPPAAAPTSGPAELPAIPETSLLGRIGGGLKDILGKVDHWRGDNRLTLMALGAGMAGAQSLGQGLNRGMTMAVPAMQADLKQQQINQSYGVIRDKLIKSGMSPQEAHATALTATNNPAIMQQLIPGLFGPKELKPVVTGTDKFGQPIHGTFNPVTGQYFDLAGKPITQAAPTANTDSTLTGEPFLQSLDKAEADQVKAMVEGRMAPPSGMALKTPYWQHMLQNAAQYEPGFDLTQWGGRTASVKDFASGKSSEMVRAANQTLHHTGELIDSMDKLHNTWSPQYNRAGNIINEKVLGKGAVTEFRPNAHAVAEELSKVFKGNNMSDAEIRQWEESLHENMSPEQQRAAVGKLMSLLNGSLAALEDKRARGMGQAAADRAGPLLSADSRKTLDRVSRWIAGTAEASAAHSASAAPPVKAGTYHWTPDHGLVAAP